MIYRCRQPGCFDVEVRRVFPWGRGHRVHYVAVGTDERRETSLSSFLRLYVKR
jgi:hypothetical protein